MFKIIHFLCIIMICSPLDINKNETEESYHVDMFTDVMDNLIPENYNKYLRPNFGENDKLTIVNVSILIEDISAISETEMEYRVDLQIGHVWKDSRLKFPYRKFFQNVILGGDFIRKIWLPDTIFENEKNVFNHKSIFSDSTTLLQIRYNGNIIYKTWLTSVLKCKMDLTFFPLDQQKCSIVIKSYGFKFGIRYRWAERPYSVLVDSNVNFQNYRLLGYSKSEHVVEYVNIDANETALKCDFFLARSVGYYVFQVYIPAFILVIISWMPFWLDRTDNHARVALGVTAVLTMTTIITNSRSEFPKISYLKAIDVYLLACFMMVFFSLIECTAVGYFDGKINKCVHKAELNKSKMADLSNGQLKPVHSKLEEDNFPESGVSKEVNTSAIDMIARWLFPLIFFLFNLFYIVGLFTLVTIAYKDRVIQEKF